MARVREKSVQGLASALLGVVSRCSSHYGKRHTNNELFRLELPGFNQVALGQMLCASQEYASASVGKVLNWGDPNKCPISPSPKFRVADPSSEFRRAEALREIILDNFEDNHSAAGVLGKVIVHRSSSREGQCTCDADESPDGREISRVVGIACR